MCDFDATLPESELQRIGSIALSVVCDSVCWSTDFWCLSSKRAGPDFLFEGGDKNGGTRGHRGDVSTSEEYVAVATVPRGFGIGQCFLLAVFSPRLSRLCGVVSHAITEQCVIPKTKREIARMAEPEHG